AEAGVHGACAQGLGRTWAAEAAAAIAVVQLACGSRLAAAMGGGGKARGVRPLPGNRPRQREAPKEGPEAGDPLPA
ncbi:MAG: hypothetical protein ACRENW_08575, partial [Thermodesulfobacteriota bacterium]